MEPQQPFDIEVLEQRAFERSKFWAKLFDDFEKKETNVGINIDDFDEIFKDDDESDGNDLDGTYAPYDDEALVVWEPPEMPNDHGQKSYTQSKQGGSAVMSYGSRENKIDNLEMQDLLNQTLPILEEHKRKWQEAGIETVLNTFDVNKIEEQVGGWLRRNNSAYFDRSPVVVKRHNKRREMPMDTDCSDAESMHSVDTARYIRSSRKNHGHHRSVSAHCTKTTIKTYRMVKSKRDELRKKYGCPEYDDDHRHRIQEVKCRRLLKQQRDYDDSYCHVKELQKSSAGHHISPRRKQLRKRRSNSLMMILSSEEELDESLVFCKPGRCCSMQHSAFGYRQKRSPLRSHCTANGHSVRHVERSLQCEQVYMGDGRPYRRENECRCRNDSQLCESVRHLVNSSTEEWLVENSDSFEKTESNSFKSQSKVKFAKELIIAGKQKSFKSIFPEDELIESYKTRKVHHISDSDTESIPHTRKTSNKSVNKSKSHDVTRKLEVVVGPRQKQKDQSLVKQRQRKMSINVSDGIDESDTETNPRAIKPSNKSENKSKSHDVTRKVEVSDVAQQKPNDQKQRTRQISDSDSDESLQPEVKSKQQKRNKEDEKETKPKPKPKSTSKNKKRKTDDDVSFEEQLKLAMKLSEKQYKLEKDSKKQESRKKLNKKSENVNKTKEDKGKGNLDNTTTKPENTFLTNISNMCNSTALSNGKAGDREFSRQPVKRVAAVSTTNSSNSSSLGSKSTSKSHKMQKSSKSQHKNIDVDDDDGDDDDTDCTIVSSTTVIEAPQSTQNISIPAQATLTPATTTSSKQRNVQATAEKGILIYAPHAREMAPSHSFQNGYFHITEEHLSKVVGESVARKFLKCYIGRRRFDISSTIYYRPPANASAAVPNAMNCVDDSDSDDDVLGDVGRCGELYESPEE